MPNIDYAELDSRTINVKKWAASIRGWKLTAVIMTLAILSAAAITKSWSLFVQLIQILIFAYFGYLVINASNRKDRWHKFAIANGWSVEPAQLDDIPPVLRDLGHSPDPSEVIINNRETYPFRLLTYGYTTGQGNGRTYHGAVVARIILPKNLPHIILDSEKNEESVQRIMKNHQMVKLEGNFSNYFRLFTNKNEQIDVLSVISPDVMAKLIDDNAQYDIEIKGNNLYIIAISITAYRETVQHLLEATKPLIDDIMHRTKSINYSTQQTDNETTTWVPLSWRTTGNNPIIYLVAIVAFFVIFVSMLFILQG